MTKNRPVLTLLLLMYSLIAHVYALLSLWSHYQGHETQLPVFLVFFFLSILGTVLEYAIYRPDQFRVCLIFHAAALILGQFFLSANVLAEIAVMTGFLVGIALYENHPANIVMTIGFSVLAALARFMILPRDLYDSVFINTLGVVVVEAGVALVACSITFYREKLIDTQIYSNRLEQAISKLSRSNQEYQDYLLTVESESTERERKRITRDIHDIVGYTLTNNIMLMEAATDMARSNPIGLTRLLNTARENAQEGLKQIRDSLYSFRKEKIFVPYGLRAVSKLVNTFRLSTGIGVDMTFGNMPWTINAEIDSALYHLLQESMINVLRHSTADQITIRMNVFEGYCDIEIRDNGISKDLEAEDVVEGIGLKGMAERLDKVGGRLFYGKVQDGFLVKATVPLPEVKEQKESSDNH